MWLPSERPHWIPANVSAEDIRQFEMNLCLGLVVLVIPALAVLAQRAIRSGERTRTHSFLIAICLLGLVAEILARTEAL
jgi:hypothetical protein